MFFECTLVDGTREDFDKCCTYIEEFGSNRDMIAFKAVNLKSDNDKSLLLQIIPKSEIKQIINHCSKSDIQNVYDE